MNNAYCSPWAAGNYDALVRSYYKAGSFEVARMHALRYKEATGLGHPLWEPIVAALVESDERKCDFVG